MAEKEKHSYVEGVDSDMISEKCARITKAIVMGSVGGRASKEELMAQIEKEFTPKEQAFVTMMFIVDKTQAMLKDDALGIFVSAIFTKGKDGNN